MIRAFALAIGSALYRPRDLLFQQSGCWTLVRKSFGPGFLYVLQPACSGGCAVAADLPESSVDRPGAASYLVKLHAARPASSEMSVAFCESREDFVRLLMALSVIGVT